MTDRNTHSQRTAAARAGFSERTARRFDADPTFPSQRQSKRRGRTVADPLDGFWETDLLPVLEQDSSVQAITLLRHLQQQYPDAFQDDRIRRTLERRVRGWRALHGPDKDIIFRQTPEPGYMCQSDFTDAADLGVTIAGDPFAHRLYHFVLVYSRWEHVGVVLGGESFTALAENLQNALWALGGVPENCRTDSLSAAFRNLSKDEREDITRRYEAFTQHYGMEASRNNRGEAHENGAVESHHRHLKVAIQQALILRGSCVYKKPKSLPAQADEAAQEAFIADYEALMTGLDDDEMVVFSDAVHPTHQSRPAHGWFPKDQKTAIKTTSGRKRLNIQGALDLETFQFTFVEAERINAQTTQQMLQKLERNNPTMTTIHVFLDNARYHHAKLLQPWLNSPDRKIKLHFLPAYAPHLNPIERLWGVMHKHVTHNQYFATFGQFTEAILAFFRKTLPEEWRKFRDTVTDNFRIVSFDAYKVL